MQSQTARPRTTLAFLVEDPVEESVWKPSFMAGSVRRRSNSSAYERSLSSRGKSSIGSVRGTSRTSAIRSSVCVTCSRVLCSHSGRSQQSAASLHSADCVSLSDIRQSLGIEAGLRSLLRGLSHLQWFDTPIPHPFAQQNVLRD